LATDENQMHTDKIMSMGNGPKTSGLKRWQLPVILAGGVIVIAGICWIIHAVGQLLIAIGSRP
jgi:hypothetical protein